MAQKLSKELLYMEPQAAVDLERQSGRHTFWREWSTEQWASPSYFEVNVADSKIKETSEQIYLVPCHILFANKIFFFIPQKSLDAYSKRRIWALRLWATESWTATDREHINYSVEARILVESKTSLLLASTSGFTPVHRVSWRCGMSDRVLDMWSYIRYMWGDRKREESFEWMEVSACSWFTISWKRRDLDREVLCPVNSSTLPRIRHVLAACRFTVTVGRQKSRSV